MSLVDRISDIAALSREKVVKFPYFSGKLQELRKGRKLTQEDLAEVVGVGQSTVQAWLAGAASPNVVQLTVLGDLFRLPTVDELVREVPHSDEFCVVPKRVLLEVVQDTHETMGKIEQLLYEPNMPKKTTGPKKTKRKRAKKK